ncbi:NAD-dependent epimerase/dehydratase family protein [Mesorhizobium sp. M3A.F.Ca.ET.080.04.2.1]|uniref:NAD-dependent epimerase/dehydratase family protein n=1 Tax=Mesorhizobium sp. M3A.F.Ca.ET.080.04.2.1 TaxID=2493676 RepID=UPI000F7526CC|nr:NAD-dependent epimerase/dehydratase family protein [Mesorhizobium sp. M3A.F.Ca.ET.080.04.2.1]AZO09179.1 NAD-dependent epimerase/dehydratase family protein [Mesorhizobium sp. M3A.F.Ca.ET.080.04.2.1]RWF20083.1 MAG: NAD-dependent epimerase/dehydratase family protein [Mesorhizobium sp.]
MTVAVFGSTGFIGRHVIKILDASGIAHKRFSHKVNLGDVSAIPIEFENPVSYRDHLTDVSAVVLLVSQSSPGSFANRAESEVVHNLLPYARFLEVVPSSSIRHIVFVSSGGTVYGQQTGLVINEDHPTRPISFYGAGKLMVETMLQTALAELSIPLTILRPSNPVGVDQDVGRVGFVKNAVHAAMTGSTLEVWGDGSAIRDYFQVEDLAKAIVLSINNVLAYNKVFNVGSGVGTSINEVVSLIERVSSRSIEISYRPSRYVDVRSNVLSYKLIADTLGWYPSRNLFEIIEELVRP